MKMSWNLYSTPRYYRKEKLVNCVETKRFKLKIFIDFIKIVSTIYTKMSKPLHILSTRSNR